MRTYSQLLLLALAPTFSINTVAQWQAQSEVPIVDYYGVEQFDGVTVNGAAMNALLRTTDNGATWDTTFVTLFGGQFPCLLYDVHFITSTIGVASGVMSTGSQYLMLRTTDAGQNWTVTYVSTTGGLVRFLSDIAFGSATEGFAVGSDNRVIRTTDGGQNWTQLNPPSGSHLYAFQYGTGNVRHIAGNGRILRSVNGGTNWTTLSFAGYDLRGLHFPSDNRGYAVGQQGAFLRTDDGGLSWTPMTVPFASTNLTDVFFTSDDVGYVTGGTRIWRTTTGGAYWEWFECGAQMNAISFMNNEGIAVGENGTMYRTTGSSTGYHPVAAFNITPVAHCVDSLVVLTNTSAPSLSSAWYYNGNLLANTTNASLVISEPQQVDTIMLVVDNGSHADTLVRTIAIAASLNISVAAALVQDTLCVGGSTQVQVPNSISGVSYRLRRGSTNIGNIQNGNGNTLTFNTGAIMGPDTLNIIATRTVTGCGTGRDSTYLMIHIGTPVNTLDVQAAATTVCIGDSTTITVSGSQVGVTYQLKRGTTNIGPAQIGNGSTLSFNTGAMQANGTFSVSAVHSSGCTTALLQTVLVAVDHPTVYFALSTWNAVAGQPVSTFNATLGGSTFDWSFGPDANPTTSNAAEPTVTFSSPGLASVSLTTTTPFGCTATHQAQINVIAPIDQNECYTPQGFEMQGNATFTQAVRFSPTGDVFLLTHDRYTPEFRIYSGHQDTISDLENFLSSDYDMSYHLSKFNSQGVPQWLTRLRFGSDWAEGGDVTIDDAGNSYVSFFHGDHHDSLFVYSTDGRYIRFQPDWNGSYWRSLVVVSWDANGSYRWHTSYLEGYTNNCTQIELDGQGSLYVCSSQKVVKLDASTGAQIWSNDLTDIARLAGMALDANGEPWVVTESSIGLRHYDGSGTLVENIELAEILPASPGVYSSAQATHMRSGPDEDLYITGVFRGNVRIGPDTLHDDLPSFLTSPDQFFLRYDPQGQVVWTREFDWNGTGNCTIKGLCVTSSDVFALGYARNLECQTSGHPPLETPQADHVLLHVDTDGGTPRMIHFPTDGAGNSPSLGNFGMDRYGLDASADGTRVAATVEFVDTTWFGTDTLVPYPSQYARNMLLGLGDAACILSTLPSATATPLSYFIAPLGPCPWQPFSLVDASLNNATQWSWEFPGAVPATSTEQNPEVMYMGSGTYLVTLTTFNANGVGTTYSANVTIDVCTGVHDPLATQFAMGPNPANEWVQIGTQVAYPAQYLILDMQGRTIVTGQLNGGSMIDTSMLANGPYVLRLRDQITERDARLLVQH